MKRDRLQSVGDGGMRGFAPPQPGAMSETSLGKMRVLEETADAGLGELLAALGCRVSSSDMADVAQNLEPLEMAMGGSAVQDDSLVCP